MARKRSSDTPPYSPKMFGWARDRAGYSIDVAAEKLGVPSDVIYDWEDERGELAPTVKQARDLADIYGRSFLEWFLPSPPNLPEPSLIPDFRLYRDFDQPSDSRELRDAQVWAEIQRENALDLYTEIGEQVPEISPSLFATIESDVEAVSRSVRDAMGFPIEQQAGFLTSAQRTQIPSIIRSKIESLGVLTLKRSDLKRYKVRGLCIAKFPLPIIVFTSESPNAQSFTLGHELGHVLTQQSAISGPIARQGGAKDIRDIESWCNKFSGAFLMPRDTVLAREPLPNQPRESIADSKVTELAQYFGVSSHAMMIRMVDLRYVDETYYWNVKKPEYDQEEVEYKSFGRPKFYGKRYVNSLGELYTSLVMEAWNSGRITNHNAAEFMGIKNLAHLQDIRKESGT